MSATNDVRPGDFTHGVTVSHDPRVSRRDGNGRQPCIRCTYRSVAGLRKGQGLCPYHFAATFHGAAWADEIYLPDRRTT